MNRNKLIDLAKKIKSLAEKGKDGEKNAAKEKLDRLCKKHNILDSEISTVDIKRNYYIVYNDSNERELLINICCMILNVPGLKWKERNNCICLNVIQTEYDDIVNAFEYYKEMYNDYKRYLMQGIISRHTIGYIPKPQNYTQENVQQDIVSNKKSENLSEDKKSEKSEENDGESSIESKKSEDDSEDVVDEKVIDPIKLMRIAVALDKKPWVKNDPNKKLIE